MPWLIGDTDVVVADEVYLSGYNDASLQRNLSAVVISSVLDNCLPAEVPKNAVRTLVTSVLTSIDQCDRHGEFEWLNNKNTVVTLYAFIDDNNVDCMIQVGREYDWPHDRIWAIDIYYDMYSSSYRCQIVEGGAI